MINSNTSFGKLKTVIVGRELELRKRVFDLSVRLFYKESLKQDLYESPFKEYTINHEILTERIQQLDNLASTLESLGIEVLRPERLSKVINIETPTFSTQLSSASNVRDVTLVYKDTIVETPPMVQNRYFENTHLYKIYEKAFNTGIGGKWIRCPNTSITESTLDLEDWRTPRKFLIDSNTINSKYTMAIDGAQFLRIGRDCIVNISNYNHWKGYLWVKSLFPETIFHPVTMCDNHIDGMLLCLKPGVFLSDYRYKEILEKHLPKKFSKWKVIYPEDSIENIEVSKLTDIEVRLASSRGMDINVLSINENTVVVNKRATSVIRALEKNNFNIVEVQLDHGEIFAGGIHCSTLDLVREDEYIYY